MEIVELLGILKDGESTTVEFKESASKEIRKCACAFANTKGGRILIGVKDDGAPIGVTDGKVRQEISDYLHALRPMPRCEIDEIPIAAAKILIITVEESSHLVSTGNTAYIRVGMNNYPLSIDEVIEKSAESLHLFFDQLTTDVPASELNQDLLREYLERRERIRGVKSDGNPTETAVRLKILGKKGKGLFLTNGGILCFTEDPEKHIGNAIVHLIKFDDNEMRTYSHQQEFTGPLQKIVGDIEKYFLGTFSRIGGFTVGFKRQEFMEFPLPAIREAVINAIIHRNYFDPADIRIFIFPDRIEIKNPGSFPPGVSVENPEHKPRNPHIAQYFYDLGLTEKYGSGINKILREVAEHPLTGVAFFPRPYNTAVIFTKVLSRIDLDQTNLKILEVLAGGLQGSSTVARAIKLSRQATVDRLKNLRLLGFIKQNGEGSKTVYELGKSINQ